MSKDEGFFAGLMVGAGLILLGAVILGESKINLNVNEKKKEEKDESTEEEKGKDQSTSTGGSEQNS